MPRSRAGNRLNRAFVLELGLPVKNDILDGRRPIQSRHLNAVLRPNPDSEAVRPFRKQGLGDLMIIDAAAFSRAGQGAARRVWNCRFAALVRITLTSQNCAKISHLADGRCVAYTRPNSRAATSIILQRNCVWQWNRPQDDPSLDANAPRNP
jgi:hypothetical protein